MRFKRNYRKTGHKSNRYIRYYRKKYDKGVVFTLLFIVISLIVFIYSLIISNNKIIHSIQEVGSSRINSFSTKIENVVNLYTLLMEMGAYQYEILNMKNATPEEYDLWFKHFVKRASDTFNINIEKAYTIDFLKDSFKLMNSYEYNLNVYTKDYISNRPWFKSAINNEGEVIFSPVYIDAHDNKRTITIATTIFNGKGVLALDINVEDMQEYWIPAKDSMDKSAYVLLNQDGQYIFCNKVMDEAFERENKNANRTDIIPFLYKQIQESNQNEGFFQTDIPNAGGHYVFYSKDKQSGFIAVTILNSKEFYSKSSIWQVRYLIILLILAIASIVIYAEEQYLNKKNNESNEVINMLGNSYYAIYRINLNTEEYTIVRCSPYIRRLIEETGSYKELYDIIAFSMDSISREEFCKGFSMENIKSLSVKDRLDYGIDLYRLLEDGYKWVNLRIIIDKTISEDNILLCFKECEEERKRELAHISVLEDALNALKESSESKRILYSSVSHDMRTPLNGIIGIAELMGNYINDPVKLADYLDKIKISGTQLITLIDNFLETAKLESKTLETNIETFSIETRVGEIINIFSIIAQRDNKLFTSSFNIKHDNVKGDLNKLMHILNNILSNAFKYTNEGGIINLTIQEQETAGLSYYKFIITDNGIGMKEEFLEQIFMPFTREKRESTRRITGTGLGLSIVHSQVQHMNGKINIESKYEEGTTVTIILPFEASKNDEKKEEYMEDVNVKEIAGVTVLVVEDNVVNMQIMTELLALRKVHVEQAWNGKEAVRMFKDSKVNHFDAILMDIQMPIMDGLEAAKKIRSLKRKDAHVIPIISLSANIFEEDIRAAKEAGMNEHLAKPVNLDLLYNTLSKYIKNRKTHN